MLGLFYQELKIITIFFLFSYPIIIRGIRNIAFHSADVYSCFTGVIPHFIWSNLNSFAGCVLVRIIHDLLYKYPYIEKATSPKKCRSLTSLKDLSSFKLPVTIPYVHIYRPAP